MFRFFLLLACLGPAYCHSQQVTVRDLQRANGFDIEVSNLGYLPVSVTFDFELRNLSVENRQDTAVVPARSKLIVHRLRAVRRNSGTSYSYEYR